MKTSKTAVTLSRANNVKRSSKAEHSKPEHRISDLLHELILELSGDLPADAAQLLRKALLHSSRAKPVEPALSIAQLCKQYLEFARTYYIGRSGQEPKEAVAIAYALRPLRKMYRRLPANQFGPRKLKEVRESMIALGWCRSHVNMQTGRIKRMFKWAVSNEMLPSTAHHALLAVDGLRVGRTKAYEPEPVRPVSQELIDATLPQVSSPVAAMIRLQLLTGMRPGEVTSMRSCDIDQTVNPWIYTPEHHKTEHHGHKRIIILGPKSQEIIKPFLSTTLPAAYLFSPIDAEIERRQKVFNARKTPMSCGNSPGTNRKRRPKRQPGDRYDTQAYGHAIRYGCHKAFPAPADLSHDDVKKWHRQHQWHPHQLRHNAASQLRKQFGLDVAQVVLGHASLAVTQVYAERDIETAQKAMQQIG